MDILIYILELIKFRKEIGIEGLGTFYKQKTPGRYDAETHMFLPPSYTLSFTPNVNETTNLIAFISKKRHVSTDTAKYFVGQFVAEVSKALADGGEYDLEGFGKLSQRDGNLKFYPANEVNSGFDFFALPPVTTDLPKVVSQEVETAQPSPVAEQQIPVIETVEEEFVEEETLPQTESQPPSEKEENTKFESQPEAEKIAEENRIEEENPGGFPEIETHEQPENDFENFQLPAELIKTEAQEQTVIAEKEAEQEVSDEIVEVNASVADTHKEAELLEDDWNFDNNEETVNLNLEDPTNPAQPKEVEPIQQQKPATIIQEIDSEVDENSFNLGKPAVEDTNFQKTIVNITTPTKDWDFEDETEAHTFITDEDIAHTEEDEKVLNEKKGIPLYIKGLLVFLIIAVVAIILYFINPNIFNAFDKNQNNPDSKIAVPIAEDNSLKTQADSLDFADSIMNNAQKVGLKVEPAKDTVAVTTVAKPANTTTYEVIAAALTSKEAPIFIARLKRKGIVANIVDDMPGKLKKISIGSFNNPDSAQKYATYYRKEWKDKTIYAIPVKHK